MALLMVSYDLHKDRDYTNIVDVLTRNAGARILQSV